MGWNRLSIPKRQRWYRWSGGRDNKFHPTFYWSCDYLPMLKLKLNHVCKGGPSCLFWWSNYFAYFSSGASAIHSLIQHQPRCITVKIMEWICNKVALNFSGCALPLYTLQCYTFEVFWREAMAKWFLNTTTLLGGFPDHNSIFHLQVAMKWYTKIEMVLDRRHIVFQCNPSDLRVTRDQKKSLILPQIGCFRTVTPFWIHWCLWNNV